MRHEMVLQKEGEMELSLLTHSDNLKRVSTRSQRFVRFLLPFYYFQWKKKKKQEKTSAFGPSNNCLNDKIVLSFILSMKLDIFMVRLMALPLHWVLHCPTSMECSN